MAVALQHLDTEVANGMYESAALSCGFDNHHYSFSIGRQDEFVAMACAPIP